MHDRMGFYADHIFPRLMDWSLRGPQHQVEREKALQFDALIRDAGLEIRSLERYVLRGNPRIMAEMYRGIAGPRE